MQTVYLSDTSNPIAVAVAKFVKKGLTFLATQFAELQMAKQPS